MHTYTLSPAQAGVLAARVRLLRRRRLLTAHQAALADVLLWGGRRPGSGLLVASLGCLARLAGQARSTATEGIRRLEELGLIQRIRRRVRVAWGGSVASRVVANAYRIVPADTETGPRPAERSLSVISTVETPNSEVKAAAAALAQRRSVIEALWRKRRQVADDISNLATPRIHQRHLP